MSSLLERRPFDIFNEIAHNLLDAELPGPASLVPLSTLNPEPEPRWSTITPRSVCSHNVAVTRGGPLLYRNEWHKGFLSLIHLSHVNRNIRGTLLVNRGLWARAALARNIYLDVFVSRSLPTPVDIVSWRPQCACSVQRLLLFLHAARSIRLSLPAYTIAGGDTSHAIYAELRSTVTQLKHAEFRFAALTERILDVEAIHILPALTSVQLLNSHFALVGPNVRSIHLGQQSPALRWRARRICEVVLACPLLEQLALHTAMQPHIDEVHESLLPRHFHGQVDTDVGSLPKLALSRLRSLYISDEHSNCRKLLRQFETITGDLHVDAIASFGADDIEVSHSIHSIMHGVTSLLLEYKRHLDAVEHGTNASLAFFPDRSEVAQQPKWRNWPERIFIGLAKSENDAAFMMWDAADPAPLSSGRRCSFALRNDAMSTRPRSAILRNHPFVNPPKPSAVTSSFLEKVTDTFKLDEVVTVSIPSGAYEPETLTDWHRILVPFPRLKTISVSSLNPRVHKSLGMYLRQPDEEGNYPLVDLSEVRLPAYVAPTHSSWNTRESFNAGMRRQMGQSERGGPIIDWVALLL